MTDIYKASQYYLDIGWSVIPIVPETKTPAIKWGEFCDRYATPDEVKQWLDNGWHLAVVTGDISGICIVDDDRVKHGINEWGFTSSLMAKTQSGGKHYYFKYDRELHSHSNGEIRVDLKAWHSYCLLPPFNNREWITKPTKENIQGMISLPDETVRLINSDTKVDSAGNKTPLIMSDFIAIPNGNRNDALHAIACSVFAKHKKEDGIQILMGINQTYDPPLTKEEFKYQVGKAYQFIQNNKKEVKTIIPNTLKEIVGERLAEKPLELVAPKTGLPTLDAGIHGFVPKHNYILTGGTNVGKTSLACFFAVNVALQKKRVLYLALEPGANVVDYMASIITGKQFSELVDTDYDFGDLPIEICLKKDVKTPEALIEVLNTSEKYDLVVIDHIGYFITDTNNTTQNQANMMKIIAGIAEEKKTAVLVIAHLNKPKNKSKENFIPTMDDISGSASFKQDATDVWIIYKTPLPNDPTRSRYLDTGFLIVGKSKAGFSGVIPLVFGYKKAGIREPETFEN